MRALADDAPTARARRGLSATRRAASRCCRRHRRSRCRRHCRRPRRRRRAGSSRDEKLRKSSKPSATTEAGLRQARESARRGIAVPPAPSVRPADRVAAALPASRSSYSSPAAARHLSSTRRLPRLSAQLMPGARELLPAGADRLAGRVGLEGIEPAGLLDLDRFALAVGADDVDLAGAALAAAGEPEILHLDAALGAEDAQHVVLAERDRAGDFGDDAVRESAARPRPIRRRRTGRDARRPRPSPARRTACPPQRRRSAAPSRPDSRRRRGCRRRRGRWHRAGAPA